MLAKLRAARGIVWRSCAVMMAWCTALEASIGWVVIEEARSWTRADSSIGSGCSVTVSSCTELTATFTFAVASANPEAATWT